MSPQDASSAANASSGAAPWIIAGRNFARSVAINTAAAATMESIGETLAPFVE